jgi:hypothetical protein
MAFIDDNNNRHDSWKDVAHAYNHMTNDTNRNIFYNQCFRDHHHGVQNKTCVEIGFGMGILSLLAAQYNPKHIFAFESKKDVYEIGKHLLEKSGLDKLITLENRYITPQEIANMHDVEVLYHELLTPNFWGEHAFDFMTTGKTIIPSIYKQTIYLQELDYGEMNSSTRKSQLENFGLSHSYSDQFGSNDFEQNSQIDLKIPDGPNYGLIKRYVQEYNNLVGDTIVYKQMQNIVFKKHYPTAKPIAELVFDTHNKCIHMIGPDDNKTLTWTPDTKLSDINIVIGKQHLPRDFAIIATAYLGNYNNTYGCEMHDCTSWRDGFQPLGNFISSRNKTLQDLLINYKVSDRNKYQDLYRTQLQISLI